MQIYGNTDIMIDPEFKIDDDYDDEEYDEEYNDDDEVMMIPIITNGFIGEDFDDDEDTESGHDHLMTTKTDIKSDDELETVTLIKGSHVNQTIINENEDSDDPFYTTPMKGE